jgi:hypothetical protein
MLTRPDTIYPRFREVFKWAMIGLMLLYIINCFSPLRLHTDTIRYFRLEEHMDFKSPPTAKGAKDYLPYGYTLFLLSLAKLGILKSFTLVAINCLYLFAGLILLKKTVGASVHTFLFFTLVLLNWCMIKFAAHPLSEMQFIFFSFFSLYAFQQYSQERKWWQLTLAFALCFLAILTRTAGIALFAAILFSLTWLYKDQLKYFIKHHKIVVYLGIACFISVFFFAKQLGLTFYTSFVTGGAKQGVVAFVTTNLGYHFQEMAELFTNTSSAKVYPYMNSSLGPVLFVCTGIFFLSWVVYNLFKNKDKLPLVLRLYLGFYLVLIFNWPFYDPRFLVPVLPIMIVVLLQTPLPTTGFLKIVSALWLVLYVGMGIVSTTYYTYTSLNKELFSRKQANGVYRNEYETQFFGGPQSDTARKMDPFVMHILEKYNR